MKILTIGDVHGRGNWKIATHGSFQNFNQWASNPTVGDFPFQNWDKIVFIGDYCDSFDLGDSQILSNLNDIIQFKQVLGDKVILLLGNHDVHYIYPNRRCSGFRYSMVTQLSDIFNQNRDLFTMAWEFNGHLWTHAGVTTPWLAELKSFLWDPNYRFNSIVQDENPQTVSDILNLAWMLNADPLFDADSDSGGCGLWGSPLWVRPRSLNKFGLPNYNQIVGHTWFDQLTIVSDDNTKIYYIDCQKTERVDLADFLDLTI